MFAWLLVGTLDIGAAMIQTAQAGGTQVRLFQYIASGVYGKAAFSGGTPMMVWGLGFHYVIALAITVTFFALYPRVPFLRKSRVLTGVLCGVLAWVVTTQIVVRLSAITVGPFNLQRAAIAAGILIAAIGLPLAFLADRYYRGNNAGKNAA